MLGNKTFVGTVKVFQRAPKCNRHVTLQNQNLHVNLFQLLTNHTPVLNANMEVDMENNPASFHARGH